MLLWAGVWRAELDFSTQLRTLEYWLQGYVFNLWGLYQIVIILAGFITGKMLDHFVEPKAEAWARSIKGNPDLLRVIIAFMRRLDWLFLIIWLWAAYNILRAYAWPSHAWMVKTAFMLASVWFIVSVITRIIRNRTLARFVAILAWAYIGLYVTGLDGPVMTALDTASVTMGSVRISLYSVLNTIVITIFFLWLAVLTGNMLSNQIDRFEDLSPAYRVLIGKLLKIALITAAGAVALSATGIDLTALTVFSGAVGVGIGFGLQKVVSNFISGIIILSDKSIKPGDTISLGDTFGWIRELRARFVSVITRDGREYLIPNEDFITQQVVNWSFSSDYVRIDVDFGVSYDSDPHEVTRIAIETAKAIKRVSAYKEPVCWMTAFGDYALQFKLRFWISDPNNGLTNVRGQVLISMWDAFKEAGIEIPYPHQEVIFKTPIDVTQPQQAPKSNRKPAAPKD
jgi:small-conductance mechanosensitive channel